MTKTKIEWTDRVWNPVTGCDKTSPGCDNCYALRLAGRLKKMGSAKYQTDGNPKTSGPGFGVTLHKNVLHQPYSWKKPAQVFVNSMSDMFHPDVPESFIQQTIQVIADTPQHIYQVLTKRSQRLRDLADKLDWPTNLWMGVSVENNRYTFRVNHLLSTPAHIKFVSAEPLLGPIPDLPLEGVDWLIVGGESGPGHRYCDPKWVRELRDNATDSGVPFFFKQWGGKTSKTGGRTLDGVIHDGYPTETPDPTTPQLALL